MKASSIIEFRNPISKYQNDFDGGQSSDHQIITNEFIHKSIRILENYQVIQSLSNTEKSTLIQHLKIRKYYHNQTIYNQNDPCTDINILLEGALKLGWSTSQGKYHTDIFVPSGTLINIVPIVTGQPLLHDHIAQGRTVIANLPGQLFMDVIRNNADALFMVLKLICVRTQLNREQNFIYSTETLQTRLAKKLVFLVDYHSYQDKDKILLNLKLSQENLAELLQTSRQSINKELAVLSNQNIIEVKYNQIFILDFEKLSDIAQTHQLHTTTKFL
ncbi:Crp/Fnr family transcriptional regulator [Acinetobacter sp. V91_7]|nr:MULTISPECIES: Crp/Fnr family transcriptional regulator [unclassified Acinetobacter]MDS7936062.1 Crp/Fnr family transcriptional regulator [Acinetobacter sp. V91_4B]MDS7964330.1 Crp/Fnr family transcriptional regulator [Acinetobacter sp. V91_7]MDS8026251.1 Crp/Fnr family transcriptional regulator [Acinetobacter sp. V91_13]